MSPLVWFCLGFVFAFVVSAISAVAIGWKIGRRQPRFRTLEQIEAERQWTEVHLEDDDPWAAIRAEHEKRVALERLLREVGGK